MSVIEGRFDPVQVAQLEGLLAGLEGAVATGDGEVLLWGWLHAPGGLPELSCEVDGEVRPVTLLARPPRPDVFDMLTPSVGGAVLETGLAAFARLEPELLARAGGRITLIVGRGGERASSGNRLRVELYADLAQLAAGVLPLQALRPEAWRRLAEAVASAQGRRLQAEALAGIVHQDFGPDAVSDLSIVIPVHRNLRALRETLSYLDMDPDSGRFEVVLAASQPDFWTAIEAEVTGAATGLRIRMVRAPRPLPPGAAARVGLEVATAEHVILMSDAVCPPAPGWASSLLEDLTTLDFGAPAAMPRFDGLPHRYEPRTPPQGAFAWSHHALRPELMRLMRTLGLDVRSPGVFAARKAALIEADLVWSAFSTEDAFWLHLLNEGVRRGLVSLRSGDDFTYAPLETVDPAHTDLIDLGDAYALAAGFRRWTEPPRTSREPDRAEPEPEAELVEAALAEEAS